MCNERQHQEKKCSGKKLQWDKRGIQQYSVCLFFMGKEEGVREIMISDKTLCSFKYILRDVFIFSLLMREMRRRQSRNISHLSALLSTSLLHGRYWERMALKKCIGIEGAAKMWYTHRRYYWHCVLCQVYDLVTKRGSHFVLLNERDLAVTGDDDDLSNTALSASGGDSVSSLTERGKVCLQSCPIAE